ncbi:MAG: hypothetical protein WBO95_01020 [Candidatus Dechloromonas phosphoritropha]|nr:hypothetical protein [Candidatus Dechloromonas phosphoritropha]MBP8789736.1 hypothetical protein [Azonexus sp.]
MDASKVAPDVYKAMPALEICDNQSGLESLLLELVKACASQINNYAFCLTMQTKVTLADFQTEQRLYSSGHGGRINRFSIGMMAD